MKKQNRPLASSSSYRENVAPTAATLHQKNIGCTSVLFQLVSKYQDSLREYLASGKKQLKNAVSSPTKPKPSSVSTQQASPSVLHGHVKKERGSMAIDPRKLSRDMQRSPTLPAEMRRLHSSNSPQNSRTPPALVARLMGLEPMPESDAEKRRKLLGALEKCNEDLNALKKIIKSVQLSEQLKSAATGVESEIKTVKTCSEFNGVHQQQPSPVSVLVEFSPSPTNVEQYYCPSRRPTNGRGGQQQQKQLRKKPGEEELSKYNLCFYERFATELVAAPRKLGENAGGSSSSPVWSSKAMKESLDQVCSDIALGERREIGRIGLALHDHICRDLIEEIVREIGFSGKYALPFKTCNRRLYFS